MSFAKTLAPKSDQLNADDLLGGAIDITITAVKVDLRDKENQPTWISYQGDNGKPYKPCKQMRHVIFRVWGDDEKTFVGKSMRLYRDDSVTMKGEVVGGIRISHMSHINDEVTAIIPVRRGMRAGWKVQPLPGATRAPATPEQKEAAAKKKADAIIARIAGAKSEEEISQIFHDELESTTKLETGYPAQFERISDARAFALDALKTNNQGE